MVTPPMLAARSILRAFHAQRMQEAEHSAPGEGFPWQLWRSARLQRLFTFVYTLCKTRKHKAVTRHFPHEVADLEPALLALASQDRHDHAAWETRYVLLLWLSILVLIPFDLGTVDSTVPLALKAATAAADQGQDLGLVARLLATAKGYLQDPGAVRDAAAICLSRLMSRPDMDAAHLAAFFTWACDELATQAVTPGATATFACTGVLSALVEVAKHGHREVLLRHLVYVLDRVLNILQEAELAEADPDGTGARRRHTSTVGLRASALQRKLLTKLAARTGLTFLPPRLATWRYSRGARSLLDNLAAAGVEDAAGANASASSRSGTAAGAAGMSDDHVRVPQELEPIMDMLVTGLRDSDTVVRWSAAKGVGRLTARLPFDAADDVVEAVLSLLVPAEDDGAWHGGCLALAELARRGLLLPERLPQVVPLVEQALSYDVRRGAHSIGTHVRDAACYVAWAFARAYSSAIMAPHVRALAQAMLRTAIFDREVNCRRAASAAFQENVGRQGHDNFPHGIDILTCADYFALGNRANAYLTVAPQVAKWPAYCSALIQEAATVKLVHWDSDIRQLAALALAALVPLDVPFFAEELLPRLEPETRSPDLFTRHGAMMAAAEVVLALSIHGVQLSEEVLLAVRNIVPRAERARVYRGRGGQMVRNASCRLIECIALAGHELTRRAVDRLLQTVQECLKHPHADIQQAAAAAWRALTAHALAKSDPANLQPALYEPCAALLEDENPAVRRGWGYALGALPRGLFFSPPAGLPGGPALAPGATICTATTAASTAPADLSALVRALVQATQPEDSPDRRDAETRRNAAEALGELVRTMGVCMQADEARGTELDHGVGGSSGLSRALLHDIVAALIAASADYATDTRGDVGSWVRKAAIISLQVVVDTVVLGASAAVQGKPTQRCSVYNATPRNQLAASEGAPDSDELQLSDAVFMRAVNVLPAGTAVQWDALGGLAAGTGHVVGPACAGARLVVQPSGPGAEPVTIAAAAARLATHVPHSAADAHSDVVRALLQAMLPADLVAQVVGAMLRCASEKLDVIRATAGQALCSLLAAGDELGVAFSAELSALFPAGEQLDWSMPHVTFPRVCNALVLPPYTVEVAAGLLRSVGGLSEGVVKHSTAALLAWATKHAASARDVPDDGVDIPAALCMDRARVFPGATAAAAEAAAERAARKLRTPLTGAAALGAVAHALAMQVRGFVPKTSAELAAKRDAGVGASASAEDDGAAARPRRMVPVGIAPSSSCVGVEWRVAHKLATPALRTLQVLLAPGHLDVLAPPLSTWGELLLPLLRFRVMRSSDVGRILAASAALLAMTRWEAPVGSAAMMTVLDLLGHAFPKVRRTVAEKMYVHLLGDHGNAHLDAHPESLDKAAELLASVPWDASLSAAATVRDELYGLLGLSVPELRMGAKAPGGGVYSGFVGGEGVDRLGGGAAGLSDEHASYAALVQEMGY